MNTLFQSEKKKRKKCDWLLSVCGVCSFIYMDHKSYIPLVSILTEPNIWLLAYLSHISSKIFLF